MTDDGPLRFELDRLVTYDDDSVLSEVRRVAALLPEGPLTRPAFDAEALVKSTTLIRRFGGWRQTLDRAGLGERYGGPAVTRLMREQAQNRDMTDEDVAAELRRVAEVKGSPVLTVKDLTTYGSRAGAGLVRSRFGTWSNALEAAGLGLSIHGRRWTDDDYFDNLLAVWTHLGRAPKYAEMNLPPSRITNGAYASRFGTWGKAKAAFVERVNADLEQEQRERVEPVPASRPTTLRPRQEDQRQAPLGLRYQVLRRDRFRCVTCGRSPATDAGCVLRVDHVLAFARGGKTRLDNLRALCDDCNLGKRTGDA